MERQEYNSHLNGNGTSEFFVVKDRAKGDSIIDRIFDTKEPNEQNKTKEPAAVNATEPTATAEDNENEYIRHVERRTSRSSTRGRHYHSKRRGRKKDILAEKILLQCIASATILALTLFICIIKTDTTIKIRQGIKNIISENNSTESAKESAEGLWVRLQDLGGTVKSVFGFESNEVNEVNEVNVVNPADSPEQTEQTEPTEQTEQTEPPKPTENIDANLKGERIDEDILFEINNNEYK